MELTFEISDVAPIGSLIFSIDLRRCGITCVVGRNGVGKTTLVRAMRNLSLADTFVKSSSSGIFKSHSEIKYLIGNDEFRFNFDSAIKSLNCKKIVPSEIKAHVDVELPMPHGARFNFFQTVSDADLEIRRSIALESYSRPQELIEFLHDIYSTTKFESLIQIEVKGVSYYCILLEESKYVREDYLSSGEFFLISLYRKIKERRKLIVIDEIDISLDAAAQAHLVRKLRDFCEEYEVNILFTTHSLAMMRTMRDDELLFMENVESRASIKPVSYSYVKSILFGFYGWDKYILTEDDVLQRFLEFVINRYCSNIFYKYKIIYVGGSGNVADLMRRNSEEHFLSDPSNVITVLDGDQRDFRVARRDSTHCIPIESVEKELFRIYQTAGFSPKLAEEIADPKRLFKELIRARAMSETQIFGALCDSNDEEMRRFSVVLGDFLSRSTV